MRGMLPQMATAIEPPLAPPGAGLPAAELFVARLLVRLRRSTGSRDSFTAKFEAERGKIRALFRGINEEAGARRVLIARLPGMEDSSRNWSVWMTLDHLRIIHESVSRIIRTLAAGQMPEGQASTAAVKPSPAADSAIVPLYETSCDMLLATAAGVPELRTRLRYAHPWFGPLDAFGWYGLAGAHLAIHRGQMERIIAGLAG
jgi:hypothetical protein